MVLQFRRACGAQYLSPRFTQQGELVGSFLAPNLMDEKSPPRRLAKILPPLAGALGVIWPPYNAGCVKYFLGILPRALRRERHFALIENSPSSTQARF